MDFIKQFDPKNLAFDKIKPILKNTIYGIFHLKSQILELVV